jgi:hypothetical protein
MEAIRLAALRDERNDLFLAAGLDERDAAFETVAIDLRAQRVLVTRKSRSELAVRYLDVADASSLGTVDQIKHVLLLFLRDFETERRIAARQTQHCAIYADLRRLDARITGNNADADGNQCSSKQRPAHVSLVRFGSQQYAVSGTFRSVCRSLASDSSGNLADRACVSKCGPLNDASNHGADI